MKKKRTNRARTIKFTPEKRLHELRSFVDLCLWSLEHDKKKIARLSGLSVSTIYRLISGHYTLAVNFGTVQALGAAAGFKLELTETSSKMEVIRPAA